MSGVVVARQCGNAPKTMHCPIVQTLRVRGGSSCLTSAPLWRGFSFRRCDALAPARTKRWNASSSGPWTMQLQVAGWSTLSNVRIGS